MKNILYRIYLKLQSYWINHVAAAYYKSHFAKVGADVYIGKNVNFRGLENIYIGNNVHIGDGATFYSTRAKLQIGDNVAFGPNVTIMTGDHRTDYIGKLMSEVDESLKLPENDADVIIENDVWIGCNATILKDVKISEGSVIAAGSIVIRSTEPYSINAGIPAVKLKERFNKADLDLHKRLIQSKL